MKKILLVLIIIAVGCYFYMTRNKVEEEKFIYQDILDNIIGSVDVNKYTIYGKHLNVEGDIKNPGDYTLVFKNNEEEKEIKTIIKDNHFATNEYINEGINLEKLNIGEYLFLLKDKANGKYYSLINKTPYHDNIYYTMTKNNKNNLITMKEEKKDNIEYWKMVIEEKSLPDEYYDVIIDPGHGGVDTGASNGSYHESKYTLEYAQKLYEELTNAGLKVKMTREKDEKIAHYGVGSRTGIPYEAKAKLMLSIHFNSSNGRANRGVEIYKAFNDNNTFAKVLADNLVNSTSSVYSNNTLHQVIDGVYMRVYSKSDIKGLANDAKKGGFEPYQLDENTTYYYFIRETGGINTKAFSDGRNPKYDANPYRNSNQGTEGYLCELAYISNKEDLKRILNEKEQFVEGLKKSVLQYVNE